MPGDYMPRLTNIRRLSYSGSQLERILGTGPGFGWGFFLLAMLLEV
jgi:hypothetical protein